MLGIQTGEQPERHAHQHGQQQRRHRQLQRGRQALQDQLDRRHVIDKAVAQVAVQRAVQETEVLAPQRLVQPERGDDARAVDLVHVLANQDVDRIADGMQAGEDDHRHHQHHRRRLQQAAQQPAPGPAGDGASYRPHGAGVHSSPNTSGSA